MFGSWVLLQSERINAYAQAVIRTLQADEHQRGCLMEERVLKGDLADESSPPFPLRRTCFPLPGERQYTAGKTRYTKFVHLLLHRDYDITVVPCLPPVCRALSSRHRQAPSALAAQAGQHAGAIRANEVAAVGEGLGLEAHRRGLRIILERVVQPQRSQRSQRIIDIELHDSMSPHPLGGALTVARFFSLCSLCSLGFIHCLIPIYDYLVERNDVASPRGNRFLKAVGAGC